MNQPLCIETTIVPSARVFRGCNPLDVRAAVFHTLHFRRLPAVAEEDVRIALDQVHPESQVLLNRAAEDARVPAASAIERLCCLWVLAAAVNLADDLADGDCDYLSPRVAPGVAFLLQSLAGVFAARSALSARCWEAVSSCLVRAAAGQSLEVRGEARSADTYLGIADLIAGDQYAAYLRLLWEGTDLGPRAPSIGVRLGSVGVVLTDIRSGDPRLLGLAPSEQERIVARCEERLIALEGEYLPSVDAFLGLARPVFDGFGAMLRSK